MAARRLRSRNLRSFVIPPALRGGVLERACNCIGAGPAAKPFDTEGLFLGVTTGLRPEFLTLFLLQLHPKVASLLDSPFVAISSFSLSYTPKSSRDSFGSNYFANFHSYISRFALA